MNRWRLEAVFNTVAVMLDGIFVGIFNPCDQAEVISSHRCPRLGVDDLLKHGLGFVEEILISVEHAKVE